MGTRKVDVVGGWGTPFFSTTNIVQSTAAYLVLDNEVGLGHLSSPDGSWAGDPTHTPFPQMMRVDHVKVWAQEQPTPAAKVVD